LVRTWLKEHIDAERAAAVKEERERCKAIVQSHVVKDQYDFCGYSGCIDLDPK
jgi:hypothetical protein